MSSKIKLILVLALLCVMGACTTDKNENVKSWEGVDYYENFLWKKYVPDTIKKVINFEFNQDSRIYMKEPLVLGFFKKKDNDKFVQVNNDEFELFVDGERVPDNKIVVKPDSEKKNIGIVFKNETENKVHYWYLKVMNNGGLDRINDFEVSDLENSGSVLMEVSVEKNKIWNPLAKILTITGLIILIALVIWMFFMKPVTYPSFRAGMITLQDPEPYSAVISTKGTRMIVLTSDKNKKQSMLNRLFTGKIKYNVNPIWTSDVVFIPRDRKSIKIRPGKDFMTDSRIMQKHEEYMLENTVTGAKTKIKIS